MPWPSLIYTLMSYTFSMFQFIYCLSRMKSILNRRVWENEMEKTQGTENVKLEYDHTYNIYSRVHKLVWINLLQHVDYSYVR